MTGVLLFKAEFQPHCCGGHNPSRKFPQWPRRSAGPTTVRAPSMDWEAAPLPGVPGPATPSPGYRLTKSGCSQRPSHSPVPQGTRIGPTFPNPQALKLCLAQRPQHDLETLVHSQGARATPQVGPSDPQGPVPLDVLLCREVAGLQPGTSSVTEAEAQGLAGGSQCSHRRGEGDAVASVTLEGLTSWGEGRRPQGASVLGWALRGRHPGQLQNALVHGPHAWQGLFVESGIVKWRQTWDLTVFLLPARPTHGAPCAPQTWGLRCAGPHQELPRKCPSGGNEAGPAPTGSRRGQSETCWREGAGAQLSGQRPGVLAGHGGPWDCPDGVFPSSGRRFLEETVNLSQHPAQQRAVGRSWARAQVRLRKRPAQGRRPECQRKICFFSSQTAMGGWGRRQGLGVLSPGWAGRVPRPDRAARRLVTRPSMGVLVGNLGWAEGARPWGRILATTP